MERGHGGASLGHGTRPFNGEPCDCHEVGGDGIDDLVLKFSTPELVDALELNPLRHKARLTLTLSGSLLDGTEFLASGCILVKGREGHSTRPSTRGFR